MKIIRLQGENYKRMSAFQIEPKGNVVVISGKNAQGKTSVLDGIAMLFEGKKGSVARATPKPIKEGAETATLIAETEEFIVKKKWTSNEKEYLEITSKDGKSTFSSPQAMLDSIVGDLSFDPLEFSRLKPKEQRELLLSIVSIGIDLEKWQAEYKRTYEDRTLIGKQADALKGKLATMPAYPKETPDAEVSVATLVAEVQEAEAHNAKITAADTRLDNAKARVATLKEQLQAAENELADATKLVEVLGEMKPTKEMQAKIGTAEETNANVRRKKEHMAAERDFTEKEDEYKAFTRKIDELQAIKQMALEKAAFPVPGLGLSDDCVTFNNVPFSQCSSAEQLKVSMAIAMAKNPELRVIRITDGSLLDNGNLQILEQMADRNDMQIWIERVDDSGKVGIVIEDGKIVKDNYSSDAK